MKNLTVQFIIEKLVDEVNAQALENGFINLDQDDITEINEGIKSLGIPAHLVTYNDVY